MKPRYIAVVGGGGRVAPAVRRAAEVRVVGEVPYSK